MPLVRTRVPAALLGAAAIALASHAAAGWEFSSISEALPPPSDPVVSSDIKPVYDQQVLSVGTALGENGAMYGFRVTDDGTPHAFAIRLGTNPKGKMLDKEDMVGLTGAEDYCYKIFSFTICLGYDLPFGIRITEADTAITGYSNTADDAPVVAGALPFALFPGNFVKENANGVIASTQVAPDGSQAGVVIQGATVSTFADVPWLVAINNAADPLVLGYDGADGDCLVYGENCTPPACDDDHHGPGHKNTRGRGHEEHGNGHGYGHDHDDCNDGVVPTPAENAALLLAMHDDGSATRLRFPASAGSAAVTALFPLAINSTTAVLRGTVGSGDAAREKLLLRCDFVAADADEDGIVDCTGGTLAVIGDGIRAGTVLGFSLTDAGLLAGNHGYNAAGIGAPFLIDLDDDVPQAVSLHNLAAGDEDWEINTITDLNTAGEMIGYGYRDCGTLPQATRLVPTEADGGALVMAHDATVHDGFLEGNDRLSLAPLVSGGSGSYQYRVERRVPGDTAWTLQQDWSSRVSAWRAGSFRGEVCFRVTARDAASPDIVQSRVTRFVVVDRNDDDDLGDEAGPAQDLIAAAEETDLRDLLSLGSLHPLLLAGLVLLARRRLQERHCPR